jgi:hypothetical protein
VTTSTASSTGTTTQSFIEGVAWAPDGRGLVSLTTRSDDQHVSKHVTLNVWKLT